MREAFGVEEPDLSRAVGRLMRAAPVDLSERIYALYMAHYMYETNEQFDANLDAIRAGLAADGLRSEVAPVVTRLDASDDPLWREVRDVLF